MTFEEFVNWLLEYGWKPTGDAQHTYIAVLWDMLVERGLIVHKGGTFNLCPECKKPMSLFCSNLDCNNYHG
jgi:hypothetical protein